MFFSEFALRQAVAGTGAASRQADAGAAQPAAAAGERRTRIARNHRAVWGRGGEGGCCLRVDGALHGRRGKQRSRGGGAACAGAAQEAGSASGSGARAACPVGNCDTVCRGVVGRPPEGGERPVGAAGPSCAGAERTGCRVDRARARLCTDEPRLSCTSPCRWHARGDRACLLACMHECCKCTHTNTHARTHRHTHAHTQVIECYPLVQSKRTPFGCMPFPTLFWLVSKRLQVCVYV